MASNPPVPDRETGRLALSALMRQRNVLAALEIFNRELGDIFRITLPGFRPVALAGPEANRFVLASARDRLSWRTEGDPVVKLLRHGLLIEDGQEHDQLRALIMPALQSSRLPGYVEAMVHYTDQVSATWSEGTPHDMLVEMRRVALLIVVEGSVKKTVLAVGGSITGTVTAAATGAPLSSISVYTYDSSGSYAGTSSRRCSHQEN
jgi:cytochrome P450